MLTSLQIRDFAIVDRIDAEFAKGMSVLTGETGAGKSILVDAIGLVLGERGSGQLVRRGTKRAEFSAEFDLEDQPAALSWLGEQELDEDKNCLIRRVISADGRSRAFVNGQPVTLRQLKTLGELLLDIHGQHFHQSLGRRPVQRDLLDFFGKLGQARAHTEAAHALWQAAAKALDNSQQSEKDRASRTDLLTFQLGEIDALNLADGEIEALVAERSKLAHGSRLVEGCTRALDRLLAADTANAAMLIADARRSIESLLDVDSSLAETIDLLESANIQLNEAGDALERYAGRIDLDPARREWVEERLAAARAIARKHQVEAAEIPGLAESLRHELDNLEMSSARLSRLEADAAQAKKTYLERAGELSRARQKAASKFGDAVSETMEGLGMPGGRFEVSIQPLPDEELRPWGIDAIEFLLSANPGQPLMPLARIASGGELSRMSLAIQVVARGGNTIPTMVFDEVDSGVGGRVAEMVGRRLQEIGGDRQVLCVTHLPQVASLADHHYRVSKVSDGKTTRTRLSALGNDERLEEIARMLGGVEITQKTLDHAAEMLAGARRKRA